MKRIVEKTWNRPQTEFILCVDRFQDFEGAIRAGKSTPAVWKLINYCQKYPGIQCMISRWTDDATNIQLKPLFYLECPRELLGRGPNPTPKTAANGWNSEESYQEFKNGSRVYIRSLKSADDTARYGKFAGLTLALVWVDQPEECPRDIIQALKGRISQPGFPQQMWLTPNPPGGDHWLIDEFPEDNSIPGHRYIHTSMYDNRRILGDEYIREAEREYPEGTAMRRRMILGLRGLAMIGDAVYGKKFSRQLHVAEVPYIEDYTLIESWDFGQRHPAVSWSQFLPGRFHILGEWMGSNKFIDEAVPEVAALRNELFPKINVIRVACDPAGANVQGHGVRLTAVEVLNEHLRKTFGQTVGARYLVNANRPEKREWAIQQISGYMGRLVEKSPALLVHPRCSTIIDGFEAGYVFDERKLVNMAFPNIRRPKKDGLYDHLQNTLEYAQLVYGSGTARTVRVHNEDYNEEDRVRKEVRRRGRAGY